MSDREQPAAKTFRIRQLIQLLPGEQIRFLNQIFRLVRISGFEIELCEQTASRAADEFLERGSVAGLTLDDQRFVAFVQSVAPANCKQQRHSDARGAQK